MTLLFSGKLVKPSQLTFAKFSFVLGVINRTFNRPVISKFSENLKFGELMLKVKDEFILYLHHGFQFNWNFNYENLSERRRQLFAYCAALTLDLISNAIKVIFIK